MPTFTKPAKLQTIWAIAGDKTPPPDDSKVGQGFIVEIPTLEQFNYIEFKQDSMLAHINQRGIPEWDISSDYLANLSYVQGSNGIVYKAKTNHVGVDPVTEVGGTNWVVAFYSVTDVYTKSESDAKYLTKANNLADLSNTTTARNNLSVYSTAQIDATFASRYANLSDLANTITSFNNIKQAASESYVGALAIASDAEANAGSDNTKALTPRKLKLGFSIFIGTSAWSVAFPTWLGGAVIKGGTYSSNKNSPTFVGFATPFPTNIKTVNLNFAEDLGRGDISLGYNNESANGFWSCYHRDGSGGGAVRCSYFAFGY